MSLKGNFGKMIGYTLLGVYSFYGATCKKELPEPKQKWELIMQVDYSGNEPFIVLEKEGQEMMSVNFTNFTDKYHSIGHYELPLQLGMELLNFCMWYSYI